MTVQLTTEQEQRIQAIIHGGTYETVQDVVDAAIAAVEQGAAPGFGGTDAEWEALMLAGFDSPNIPEDEFWSSVGQTTDSMLAEHKASVHP